MVDVDLLVAVALEVLLVEHGQRALERADVRRLAAARRADDHEAVAHADHLVELDVLADEDGHGLERLLGDGGLEARDEGPVVEGRPRDAREEVRQDAVEERQVVREEFRHVHVLQRAEQQRLLVLLRRRALQVARGRDDGLDGAHAVVVVVLAAELLGAQPERRDHLLRALAVLHVAVGEEHDLADEGVVGDHHGHGPEQRLEVVRELGAARVARVHRDEDGELRVDVDVRVLEHDALLVALDGALERHDLLGDDAEDLDVDAVELVEARPRARGREALEELAHRAVVQAVGT